MKQLCKWLLALAALALILLPGAAMAAGIELYLDGEAAGSWNYVKGDSCEVVWYADGCERSFTIELMDFYSRRIFYAENESGNAFTLERGLVPGNSTYLLSVTAPALDGGEASLFSTIVFYSTVGDGWDDEYAAPYYDEVDDIDNTGWAGGSDNLYINYDGMYIYNCQEWVSLRSAPRTTAERIAQLPFGAWVTEVEVVGSGFCQVNYNGLRGYVQMEYLTNDDDAEPLSDYSTPGRPGSAEEETLESGFDEIYPDFEPWFECEGLPIDFSGVPYGEYLFAGGFLRYRVVNCDSYVNLREEANSYTDSVMRVPRGEYVDVCGELNGWMLCRYGGRFGWIKSGYLSRRGY